MGGRDLTFLLKLSGAERDDLARRAAEEGITRADLIRGLLGWETGGREPRATPSRSRAPRKTTTSPRKPGTDPPTSRRRSSEPPPLSELLRRVADRESR